MSEPTPANVYKFERKPKSETVSGLGESMAVVSSKDKGMGVVNLQKNLTSWGFDPGAADGIYGPKTRAAVIALQKFLKVPETGEFDAKTVMEVLTDLDNGGLSKLVWNGEQKRKTTLKLPASAPRLPATTSAPDDYAQPAVEENSSKKWLWLGLGGLGLGALLLMFLSGRRENLAGADEELPGEDYFGDGEDAPVAPVEGVDDGDDFDPDNLPVHGEEYTKAMMEDLATAGVSADELKRVLQVDTRTLMRLRRGQQDLSPDMLHRIQPLLRKHVVGLDDDSDMDPMLHGSDAQPEKTRRKRRSRKSTQHESGE